MDTGLSTQPFSVQTADTILKRHPMLMKSWHYEVGVMLKAIERVWRLTGDFRYFEYIRLNLDCFIDERGGIRTYTMNEYNLDQINTGKAVLALYRETGESKYEKAASLLREQLKGHPRTSEGGFWHKQIYPSQMWLDGVYMAAPFYAEYALIFNEPSAFADVIKQFTLLYEHANDSVTGLLYHAWNETKEQQWADPRTGCSPHFWGRAMGWYMMALVDVLEFIPESVGRVRLVSILNSLADALEKVQDKQSKVWYQVLDQGERAGNYLEASASSMFVYALAKGFHQGYLDQKYQKMVEDSFAGLVRTFVEIEGGFVNLTHICSVAGLGKYKEDMSYRDGSFNYYVGEPVVANDFKGVGPFVMAAAELGK